MRAVHKGRACRRPGVAFMVAAATVLSVTAGSAAADSAQAAKSALPAPSSGKRPGSASDVAAPRQGVFGPSSVWKQKIVTAPVASNSAALVRNLASQVSSHWGGVAAFNVWQYNTSFYRVPAGQPKVDVKWWNCQNKTYEPRGLLGQNGQFSRIPIPSDAVPAAGTDGALTIYDPSTDTMWDLWKAVKRADGWYACWGGRMDRVAKSPGYFYNGFGTSASGLSTIGGSIGVREAQAGVIEHALALQVVKAAQWRNYSWPAQRSDGWDYGPNALPEGTRLRLDPRVNVDSLGLHPLAAMIAKAAQTYGFIVTDQAGAVSVVTESGTPLEKRTGVNPWTALMRGSRSYEIMRGFPWHRLQALPKDYGKP